MRITVDLEKQDLESIFKDWEIEIVEYVLKNRDVDSRTAYSIVKDKISRASVITFLQTMKAFKFVDSKPVTSKGGYKTIYSMDKDIENKYDLIDKIGVMIFKSLSGELGDGTMDTIYTQVSKSLVSKSLFSAFLRRKEK